MLLRNAIFARHKLEIGSKNEYNFTNKYHASLSKISYDLILNPDL